jgi:hypothetical protein
MAEPSSPVVGLDHNARKCTVGDVIWTTLSFRGLDESNKIHATSTHSTINSPLCTIMREGRVEALLSLSMRKARCWWTSKRRITLSLSTYWRRSLKFLAGIGSPDPLCGNTLVRAGDSRLVDQRPVAEGPWQTPQAGDSHLPSSPPQPRTLFQRVSLPNLTASPFHLV